jgi:hypothetical protein
VLSIGPRIDCEVLTLDEAELLNFITFAPAVKDVVVEVAKSGRRSTTVVARPISQASVQSRL